MDFVTIWGECYNRTYHDIRTTVCTCFVFQIIYWQQRYLSKVYVISKQLWTLFHLPFKNPFSFAPALIRIKSGGLQFWYLLNLSLGIVPRIAGRWDSWSEVLTHIGGQVDCRQRWFGFPFDYTWSFNQFCSH